MQLQVETHLPVTFRESDGSRKMGGTTFATDGLLMPGRESPIIEADPKMMSWDSH